MFGEALKTNEKERYDSKIEISNIEIPDTPLKKNPKSLPKILIILSQFYCGRPAHKSPLNFFPRSAPYPPPPPPPPTLTSHLE